VAQPRQVEARVELLLEAPRELGLGDLSALERVQRCSPCASVARCMARPSSSSDTPASSW
jgi:hypothetical protein